MTDACSVLEDEQAAASHASLFTDVYTTREEFLRDIYTLFLKLVDPSESGILDLLRAADAMSADEEEEVNAKPTRIKKARRCWRSLNNVPPKVLDEKVLPFLEKTFPHMLKPGVKYHIVNHSEKICLRHAIMSRSSVEKFADIFPPVKCCPLEEWSQLLDTNRVGEEQWMPVFDLLKKYSHSQELMDSASKLLTDKKIDHPDDFTTQFRDGFPCTCIIETFKMPLPPKPKKEPKKPEADLDTRDNASSGNGYPNTSASSENNAAFSDSESVQSSEANNAPSSSQHHSEDTPTHLTEDEKGIYKATLLKVDKALVSVSAVRTEFRRLEAVNDQLNLVMTTILDSSDLTRDAVIELTRLEGMMIKAKFSISCALKGPKIFLRKTKEPDLGFKFKMPPTYLTILVKKRYRLENELKEAEHFSEKSRKLIHQMQESFCTLFLENMLRCRV